MALAHVTHTMFLGVNVWVMWWHRFSPDSAGLPGQLQYGWFFRYLTFCSFTWQTIALALFLISELTKGKSLRRLVDTMFCAGFAIANMVTLMWVVLHFAGDAPWESKGKTPLWLTIHQHGFNSVITLVDLVLAPSRTFSSSARSTLIGCIFAYCGWMQVLKNNGGTYPYPMFEKWPLEMCAAVFVGALTFLLIFFYTGKGLRYLTCSADSDSSKSKSKSKPRAKRA